MNNKFKIIIVFLLFLISIPCFLQNGPKNQLIQKKKKIEKELEIANKLLEETRGKKKNSLHELKILKTKIKKRNNYISQLEADIFQIEKEIERNTKLIASYNIELDKKKSEYSALVYYAFKNQSKELNMVYLLASNNLNEFYSRLKYLQQYKEYRKEQIQLIDAINKIVQNKVIELNIRKDEKEKLINLEAFEKSLLIRDSEEKDKVVKELKSKEKELTDDIEEKKRIFRQLDREIESLIKKEAKKSNFSSLNTELKIISKNFEENKGRLPWPTSQGIVINKFGDHPHPVIKGVNISNNGIDISTVKNSGVHCIFKGRVSKIFNIKGANSTIIIQHGNYFSVYHNIINVSVKSGQEVNIKQKLGDVYTDNKIGESVLHLEIWKELEKQDPEIWLAN